MKTLEPRGVVEWIPYNNLENIKYLTKGGCSEIYTARWIDGQYIEWDSDKQQLKRFGTKNVILKKLENVESANQSWFEEAKSHLTINNKWDDIVRCYEYLQQNHNQLTWKRRIGITFEIINALFRIHEENAIHRDLHSGNILYSKFDNSVYISDLGFCGPADKPSKSIYGNLPYIAPEVLNGKEYTFKSDIYRTPLEYISLMKQCWDADPLKRPDIYTLLRKIREMNLSYNQNNNLEINDISSIETNYTSSKLFTSKVYQFENLPEPKNATEEEQEAFHSKPYNYNIPDNIDDFIKSSSYTFEGDGKSNLTKVFNELQVYSKNGK
ncbi:kinase-like domain-containing protein [Glomus cerebriforme]|uniref:Kinase-like domain-containing protein n=1 Tax=Glomus cerebriforme TaxID=658196 RepID=A0A397SA29_9GLOM|nr:kinase-like domain-containing protein [Glomus cerebriforme]